MDDEAADRLLRVGDLEQDAPAARLADLALVADLAAALGVEGRAIEDDLGLAAAGQVAVLRPVAHDRDDAALGGRRLVAEELGVAGPRLDGAVQGSQLGMLRQLGLPAGARAVALFGQGALEPGSVDADAVLGGELDGEVDREAVGVVEPEREVAIELRGVARQVLGAPPDDPLGRRERGEGLVEVDRPRVERPRELRLLARDGLQDLVACGRRGADTPRPSPR